MTWEGSGKNSALSALFTVAASQLKSPRFQPYTGICLGVNVAMRYATG